MKTKFLSLCAAIAVGGVFGFAQDQNSMPSFAPEIKRVAVFKNGYAFTYREGLATTANNWVFTTNTPAGMLGTVWGYTTSPNTKIVQLLASNTEIKQPKRVESLAEFLLANENSKARFVIVYPNAKPDETGTPKTVEGSFQIISQNSNFFIKDDILKNPQSFLTVQQNPISVLIRTADGTLFVHATQIQSVEILGAAKIEKPATVRENRLAMKVTGANNENLRLGIAALERGVQWIPAYRVEVKGEPVSEAKIELEAMLINDIGDLKDTEVYFVVGVPNFIFQNTPSPLSLKEAFQTVSNNFSGVQSQISNAVMSNNFVIDGAESSNEIPTQPATVSDDERSETFKAQQLFLYKTEGITLKKGERASMRLFSLTVPCAEVFEWTIDNSNATVYAGSDGQPYRSQSLTNRFWYGLKLKNQTGMPWTTAPALSFREWQPMGQDLLTFTPVGGENVLRVSPATEVIGNHVIEEKARVTEQKKVNGKPETYDLITLEGIITVNNVKAEAVQASITRRLSGNALNATDNGTFKREGANLQAQNPNSIIKWNLTIPAGEKEIRYTYKVYVRK